MKRLFFLFLIFSAFAVTAYTGSSTSFNATLATNGNTVTSNSSNFSLQAVIGTVSGSFNPDAAQIFTTGGTGFLRAAQSSNPLINTVVLPSSTCCGPYTFKVMVSDPAGRGINQVLLAVNGITNMSANLISGNVYNGTWSVTYSQSSSTPFTYQVYAQSVNGFLNATALTTFTISPAAQTSGASPTPSPAATSAPTVQPNPPVLIPNTPENSPAAGPVQSTETLGASSKVSGSFSDSSSTITYSYTAPPAGFTGTLSEEMNLDYSDYAAGLIHIDPEPIAVRPGSVIATWDLSLAPKQVFTATVDVAKKLDPSILKGFKAPKLVAKSTPSSTVPAAAQTAAATNTSATMPTPASTDNALWYVVGALVLLGLLYYVLVGGKRKPKGL